MPYGRVLFRDGDLSDELRRHAASMESLVSRRYQGPKDTLSDEQIIAGIADEASFQPIAIDFENPKKSVVPARVLVRDFKGAVEIDGVRATYLYEFKGDSNLFFMRPNSWGSQIPNGEVTNNTLSVAFEGHSSSDPLEMKKELERQRDLVKYYLDNQSNQIAEHNRNLFQTIASLVTQRRGYLDGLSRLRNAI